MPKQVTFWGTAKSRSTAALRPAATTATGRWPSDYRAHVLRELRAIKKRRPNARPKELSAELNEWQRSDRYRRTARAPGQPKAPGEKRRRGKRLPVPEPAVRYIT